MRIREARVKDYLVPFVAALAAFGVLFLALDFAVMRLQGLTLIFQQ